MPMELLYSATLIIRTPLATALRMLAYRTSEIVRITEVLSFLEEGFFDIDMTNLDFDTF